MTSARWQFWVDRGGTFTDIVARRPDGTLAVRKLLSEHPERYRDAAVHAIREFMGIQANQPVDSERIEAVKMGTTVATNALLERQGDRTLLLITRGFRDALRIAYQNRPAIFARHIVLPQMLYERVVEVDERIRADGHVLQPLDEAALKVALVEAYEAGLRTCAIVLMHGYRYTEHEKRAAAIAHEVGFTQISVSHHVSPLMKLVSRGDTTVVDAYLSPVLRRYVAAVTSELGGAPLLVMQSNGGLTDAARLLAKDSLLSGPAGGIVGAIETSRRAGVERIIGFDMGGTSTDVSHYDGVLERTLDAVVAGVRIRAPMLHIHTIAAGGGSVLHFDGLRFRVGPDSAGASPGPACYGRGGPLTVTDANVMTGKLDARFFPAVLGNNGDQPLDTAAVSAQFTELAESISRTLGRPMTPEQVAEGFLQIAVENMSNAIKEISIQRGHDVTAYTLCGFGGASGQHACLVADALGMQHILFHPLAGVLSAYGMGLAAVRLMREAPVEARLESEVMPRLEQLGAGLDEAVLDGLREQGFSGSGIELHTTLRIRMAGADAALRVAHPRAAGSDAKVLEHAFATAHRQRYGFDAAGRALIVEAIEVEGVARMLEEAQASWPDRGSQPLQARGTVRLYSQGRHHDAPVYQRDALCAGDSIDGPAIIAETIGTIVVEPDWRLRVTAQGHLELRRPVPRPSASAIGTDVDPIRLEVYANLFMSIAEQMGTVLEHTSHSVNIKERLDFSCALFDRAGELVANAPHMPVHLGSMGDSVQTVIRQRGDTVKPGNVYMLNAPYNGGTHLPDITVVTPVFLGETAAPDFWVASRAHHADIGGISPGSMPPTSRTIDDEGVLIDDFLLVERGVLREAELRALLTGGAHPARNPSQNVADLAAQIAANETGAQELRRICKAHGADVVHAYMGHVQDYAEAQVRSVLGRLTDGSFAYELDNGAHIAVAITIDADRRGALIDFTGTSAQLPDNFNAPSSICKAAVLYVFRTLLDVEIPINSGCLRPLRLRIPPDSMLSPRYPAAVVAGNVETSQAIVDALYGALGVLAASQGTMNNFTFGDDEYQYYETICGGTGAGPDFDGTSAVHSHMTNSRLTDPEVLEWRFPVLLERFEIRAHSGGEGLHRGGDGTRREIRFLRPMSAGMLANHRRIAPFGLAGGHPGATGADRVRRSDGRIDTLSGNAPVELAAGDTFVIETPGGGGFGAPVAPGRR